MSLSREFAGFVAGLQYENLPPEVVDRAKGVTLQAVSSALIAGQAILGELQSGGYFGPRASAGKVIQLFYLGHGPNGFGGGSTVENVVAANPQGSVAIVSLHLHDDE